MRRTTAAAGSVAHFVLQPGLVAGLVPWWMTHYEVRQLQPYWAWVPLQVAGAALVAAGTVVLVQGFVRFVVEGMGTPAPIAPTRQLVVGGPYRYVRNPMYLAVTAVIVGQALALGRPAVLLYATAVGVAMAAFVHGYEEPALYRQFGAQYEAYRRAVPAWWPRRHPWPAPAARRPARRDGRAGLLGRRAVVGGHRAAASGTRALAAGMRAELDRPKEWIVSDPADRSVLRARGLCKEYGKANSVGAALARSWAKMVAVVVCSGSAIAGCEGQPDRAGPDSAAAGAASGVQAPTGTERWLTLLPPGVRDFLVADPAHPFGQPAPDAPTQMRFFGRLAGVWGCRINVTDGAQTFVGWPAVWAFKYSAGGHAIEHLYLQDKYHLVPPWQPLERDSHSVVLIVYEPGSNRFRFLGANNFAGAGIGPSSVVMTGRQHGDEVSFVRDRQDPTLYVKDTFYDIEADSFWWRQEESKDRGRRWEVSVRVDCRRRAGSPTP